MIPDLTVGHQGKTDAHKDTQPVLSVIRICFQATLQLRHQTENLIVGRMTRLQQWRKFQPILHKGLDKADLEEVFRGHPDSLRGNTMVHILASLEKWVRQ